LAVHELLVNNDEIKQAIQKNEQTDIILNLAIKGGMRSLRTDGIQKVINKATTLMEILRVTG
jgi:type II secretory ATPase GspE/PulE/Tfp pilus assembly ATPase PilB-like protein